MKTCNVPHPIPYQGSKRNLADDILRYFPRDFTTLYEPFAGSAAITIAAAVNGLGRQYHINDLNKPLMDLWQVIIESPEVIAEQYASIWSAQLDDPKSYFNKIRDEFNITGRPELFLYLLARCVKASVRYNSRGEFNQSPDNRRHGMLPDTMRRQIVGVSHFLQGKTTFSSLDYREILSFATPNDLVYMDPPYQGVCSGRDSRYLQSVLYGEFVDALESLNKRQIRFIVSYDGRTGTKTFGEALPHNLNLTLIELHAGRSTQATLLGRDDETIESLYLSQTLACEMTYKPIAYQYATVEPFYLMEGRS